MHSLRFLFLALALWGAVHPMTWFLRWFRDNGFDILGMVDAWHANAASSGLVWDLTISAIVLTVWVIAECARTRRWSGLAAIPATFLVGVSFGLPLYLFLRAKSD